MLNNGQVIEKYPGAMTQIENVDVDRNSMYENFHYFKQEIDELQSRVSELEGKKPGGIDEQLTRINHNFQQLFEICNDIANAVNVITGALKELKILESDEATLNQLGQG